jgi:virulence factor Mce-like protein
MRRGRISDFAAGLIAIGVILAVSYLAIERRLPFAGDYEIKAVVTQANELHSRTPVRIAGVEVGKVKKTERGPGATTIVTMKLDEAALPLHRDATLKVRPRIFLEGNFFIDLKPGTPSAPELHEGDTIPLSHTAVAVQLDEILTTLNASTRDNLKALVHAYAQAVDGGGADAFRGSFPYARPAFLTTAQLAEAGRGVRPHDLSDYVRDGGRTAAAIARSETALADLVTGLNRSLRGLAARPGDLEQTVAELSGTLDEAGPALDAINRALPPTRAFIREVRPGLRQAPATLRLGNPLLAQLEGLVSASELPALVAQLDPAIASLSSLEPKLTTLFRLVTPVTECARRNVLPTLTTTVDDPPLSTGSPLYREFVSGLTGLSSATQNFTGNGQAVRYHAGFGDQQVTFGRAPSAGEPLVGLTSEPLLGSRPRRPDSDPPFRPDVPCVSQQAPNMRAATGPAPEQGPAP